MLDVYHYKPLLAIPLGAIVGIAYSRLRRCSSGACPQTSHFWRAGLYGAAVGLVVAMSWMGQSRSSSDTRSDGANVSVGNSPAPAASAGPQQGEIAMAKHIESVEDFDRDVLQASKPVLVDFFATWCGPCRMVTPIMEQLASELSGRIEIMKVDVDKVGDIATRYRIMGVPTVMLFDQGKVVKTFVGVRSKADYLSAVQQSVGK